MTTMTSNEAADWAVANPVLALGTIGIESDTDRMKVGDGVTAWNALGYTDGLPAVANPVPAVVRTAPGPTGVAADDTAALDAFMATTAEGDSIHFPRGTYVVNDEFAYLPNRTYVGAGTSKGVGGTTFKMADGANLDAVWCAEMWLSASATPSAQSPVIIRDILFDANRANQTSGAGHGLVGMNFYSVVVDCKAKNTRGDGFRWSAYSLAGNAIVGGNCPESYFIRLDTLNVGGDGIRTIDTTGGLLPDGYLIDCKPTDCEGHGVRIDNAKGWLIDGNHPYANEMSGMKIGRAYMTKVTNNYCEGYGSSATAGTYCGIDMSSSAMQGGGVVVCDNIVWANSDVIAASTCRGIAMTVDNDITATGCVVTGNVGVGRTDTLSTSGLLLNCNNAGATLEAAVGGNAFKGWAVNYHVGTTGTVKLGPNGGQTVVDETFSATPTISSGKAYVNGVWRMILTGNVTSSTITDGVDGQSIVVQLQQDANGTRTFAWPSNVTGAPVVATGNGAVTTVPLTYIASTDKWYAH